MINFSAVVHVQMALTPLAVVLPRCSSISSRHRFSSSLLLVVACSLTVFLQTCHAGAILRRQQVRNGLAAALDKRVADGECRVYVTATVTLFGRTGEAEGGDDAGVRGVEKHVQPPVIGFAPRARGSTAICRLRERRKTLTGFVSRMRTSGVVALL
jgi:hypothetical protein